MKKLVLKSILLISLSEYKAKKILFDPKRTIIVGSNQTGKSCLIKSIYNAFGANTVLHPKWKKTQAFLLVTFEYNSSFFHIFKSFSTYTLFDNELNIIGQFNEKNEESMFLLANFFDFNLTLSDSVGEANLPTPEYMFFPFYIDQDSGWQRPWSSFIKNKKYNNWKKNLIDYYLGIKPEEFYKTLALLDIVRQHKHKITNDLEVMKTFKDNVSSHFKNGEINIEIDLFNEELETLESHVLNLTNELSIRRKRIIDLKNEKMLLQIQKKVAKSILGEIGYDFDYSNSLDSEVSCPTCGAKYDNGFTERFDLMCDHSVCEGFVNDLDFSMIELDNQLNDIKEQVNALAEKERVVQSILDTKKENIKLQDIIHYESKKEVNNIIKHQLEDYEINLQELLLEEHNYKEILNKFTNEYSKHIMSKFSIFFQNNLDRLSINDFSEKDLLDIYGNFIETGSARPRALFAYYFAILNSILDNKNTNIFPLVIDSPNQQGLDHDNLSRVISFINNNVPDDVQLILGVEEDLADLINGTKILLKDKNSLLNPTEFNSVLNEIKPFIDKIKNI